ncbi:uncharacterized protein LOC133901533 [Phragmites australis]|uniref:uncharacterized protein LOC133901533 n=1 Tax=Phragmites australis TaxID=29695 RepID=UPI002D7746BD|nr:uncharacterized protein LOC133901533 [Phragmites australis]
MRTHQRVHYANVTPEDKQAKRDREKALKDLRRNTRQDSIAIQNPMYVPEVVPLTVDASGPHGSTVTRDWSILAVTGDDDGVIFEEDSEDEEGYMFGGQDGDINEDVKFDQANDDSASISSVPDKYDHVYSNIPPATHILKPIENCQYCNAKKFEHETKGFCCLNGKIKVSTTDTPPELMRLWSSADADARHFRDNIRFFNGHFSFTSLYCHLDSETTDMRKHGIYTFHAHGQMYHNIRSFGRDGSEPKHLELYFYDDDPSLELRYRHCREEQYQQDNDVIRKLVGILRGNSYSEQLRSMGQVEGSERQRQFENSVILQGKNREVYGIRSYHGCYDALSYLLFFPRGELGWHTDIPKVGVSIDEVNVARKARGNNDEDPDSGGRLCVSVRDYYCYKFQIRPGIFNSMLFGKRLFQQFTVDTYIKIESSRLDYIWAHQRELRADLYQGLVDNLHAGERRADAIGKWTVLATSFIGGPRDKRLRYMDAMALVRKYRKPDVFLTMTCNPNWDEITRELYPGQIPQDRPNLILEKDILGKVKAYVYVVEFQKRGLPHAHFLLIMLGRYKLTCPEQYDCLISVELPEKHKYPELYKMVVKHMMHGRCSVLNRDCPCTKNRPSCKNHYPRPFNATTLQGKDSYPVYRRREDGRCAMVRKHLLDNRWVIPYNPYLLWLFNCHINVKACSSIKAVKYLFKYIFEGHDRASMTVTEADKADINGNIDEIRQYRDARWVTPPEALWRIYGFELSKNSPPVMQLQLHPPNMHIVSFQEGQDIRQVVNRECAEKSMLTEYFEANRLHEHARERQEKNSGKEGFEKLVDRLVESCQLIRRRMVDGEILPTFREAAERRGLIEADNTLDECLTEAELFQMPPSLRRLFATTLVFSEPNDVRGL